MIMFHHVCIVASDYRKAVKFYVDCLGFEIRKESYSNHRNAKKLELYSNGRYIIELFVKEGKQKVSGTESKEEAAAGLDHVSFMTEDVAGVLKHLTEKKVRISEIKEDINTGKKYGFCWDPDGVKIEFYEQ